MYQPLIDNLKHQVAIYCELLELARQKNGILIEADTNQLSAITSGEWALLKRAGKLEKERMEILTQMTAGTPEKLDSIDKAIKLAGEPEKQQLKAIKDDLLATIADYKEINELNKQLLEVHLQYTEYMVNVFSSASNYNNAYDSTGHESNSQPTHLGGGIIDSEV